MDISVPFIGEVEIRQPEPVMLTVIQIEGSIESVRCQSVIFPRLVNQAGQSNFL